MEKPVSRSQSLLVPVAAAVAVVCLSTAAAMWKFDGPNDVGQRPTHQANDRGAPVETSGADRGNDPGEAGQAGQSAVPERLTSTDLDLSAQVDAVGVDDESQVEVPEDVTSVGWYRFGPTPGDRGSSVLVGHVDSAEQGRGALWALHDAETDDVVTVHMSDGSKHDFRVVAREQIDKSELPVAELFDREGDPRLTLITCGGDFDTADASYTANVVVTALPMDDA